MQALLYLLSGASFSTHQQFAFLTGAPSLYLFLFVTLRVLSRSRWKLTDIGLARRGWVREALLGVPIGFALFLFAGVLFVALEPILPASTPGGAVPRWAAFVYGFAVLTAFAPIEEIIWRGYAITVLREHLGANAAVLVSAVGFGVLHWWGGLNLVVASTLMGVVYAGLFLWRRSLVVAPQGSWTVV